MELSDIIKCIFEYVKEKEPHKWPTYRMNIEQEFAITENSKLEEEEPIELIKLFIGARSVLDPRVTAIYNTLKESQNELKRVASN